MSVFVVVLLIGFVALALGGFLIVTSPAWGRLLLVALLTRALDRPQAPRILRGGARRKLSPRRSSAGPSGSLPA